MVLAVEEAIEYVTEGADMVEVVQDDHSGELCVRLLRVTLFCQVGQVLTQVLGRKASAGLHLDTIIPKVKDFKRRFDAS